MYLLGLKCIFRKLLGSEMPFGGKMTKSGKMSFFDIFLPLFAYVVSFWVCSDHFETCFRKFNIFQMGLCGMVDPIVRNLFLYYCGTWFNAWSSCIIGILIGLLARIPLLHCGHELTT